MANVEINQLPDLCLDEIFKMLPDSDFMILDEVCTLWSNIQRRIASKVTSLTVLLGENAAKLITDCFFTPKHADKLVNDDGSRIYVSSRARSVRLEYPSLSWILTHKLVTLFPNITSIEISAHEAPLDPSFGQILYILWQWAPQLVSIKIHLNFKGELNDFVVRGSNTCGKFFQLFHNFLRLLNNCPALEHLTIDARKISYNLLLHMDLVEQILDPNNNPFPSLNPLFSRIREFNLHSLDPLFHNLFGLFINLIEPNAQNGHIEKIGLGNGYLFTSQRLFQLFSEMCPHVMTKLDAISIRLGMFFNLNTSVQLISSMVSLTTLRIEDIELNSLFDVLRLLSHLPKLSKLFICELHFFVNQPLAHSHDRVDFIDFELKELKVLTIQFGERFDAYRLLNSRHWPTILPHVQVLELIGDTNHGKTLVLCSNY